MTLSRLIPLLLIAALVSGCSSKFRSYDGPEVTRVVVFKENRRMYLLHEKEALRAFDIELGFEPEGDKEISGDGKTPEGHYLIDRRNPDSTFHLSLGVSYPSQSDVENAQKLGIDPGGDIFIHGTPSRFASRGPDWTWGCIAVSNREIEDIYAMVGLGTVISIYP
ncbi:MAG: L,D-transpeptidase family protein [Rhodobacteraceae bacterium]|nr:L,D-transpeptidase family protein [Paracoccaceae bacterium]